MEITSKFFGAITVEQNQLLNFPNGILGFEEYKEFALIPLEENSPFIVLQSTKEESIGFVLAFPFVLEPNYAFDISDEDKTALKIDKEEDVTAYAIVTLKEKFEDSTMNLLSPIIVNMKEKQAKQIVLTNGEQYTLRHPISKGAK